MLSRRQFIAGAAFAGATAGGIVAEEEAAPNATFNDDFNGPAGSAPDPAKWTYDLGAGGWGNNELETYTDSRTNSYIDGNSNLVIAATEVNGAYFSARLTTQRRFSQIGGHFEARIKLASQLGVWPAFWLLGQDIDKVGWPGCGEIDIYENFGYSGEISSSVYAQKSRSDAYEYHAASANDGNWHVYRADVNAGGITFSRDGHEYGHCPHTFCPSAAWKFGPYEPNNGGMYFLLNVAVGGNSSQNPPPDTTKFPATMLVDYVRAGQ
jgi:beta-glucanase (GH16 family)